MQCHGGLKGPLRRIIRSLGNDRVGNAYRSHSRRHLIERATSSSSPPKRCNPPRDDSQRYALKSVQRPRSGIVTVVGGHSCREYATQSTSLASHSEPEQKEEILHDDDRPDSHDPPDAIARTPIANSCGDEEDDLSAAGKRSARPPESTNPSTDPAFIRRYLSAAPIKEKQHLSTRHAANVRKVLSSKRGSESRAHQIQQERHNYAGSNDWRIILRTLDEKTMTGPMLYKKRLETVMLPKGVLAKFHSNAGVSFKEIMEHTGCHVQVAREVTHCSRVPDAFAGFDLLGSSSQITRALKILPRYLDVMPEEEIVGAHVSNKLEDHALGRRISSEEEMKLASLAVPNTVQEEEQGSFDVNDLEHLENELNEQEGSSTPVTSPVRSTWTEDRTRKLNLSDVLEERPKSLATSLEVSAYVAELCQSKPQELRRVSSNPAQRDHVRMVMEKLISLFSTPGVASMATSTTVDLAINFLTKYNDFAAFRAMYRALEDGNYVFTVSNWNRCLAAAAKAGDLHNYRYSLGIMLRQNLRPDPVTWATFHDLICRRFAPEASSVAEIMRQKGLLWDHHAAKLVAQNAVGNDLASYIARGGRIATFFKLYDNRFNAVYGLESFNWLSVGAVNRMIAVLASAGQLKDAFEVLAEFGRRNSGWALDTVGLNTLLTSSLRDEDPASAVSIVQHFRIGRPGALVPNRFTYRILFTIAWRRRYHNMLRVIWRYACAAGQVDPNIRYRMKRHLNFFMPTDDTPNSSVAIWHAVAPKFAVGMSGGFRTADKGDAVADQPAVSPLESQILQSISMGRLSRDSPQFHGRRDFLHGILADDLAEVGMSEPEVPFAELLEAAWKKDGEWKKRELGRVKTFGHGTFQEMLDDGIKVPMRKGNGTVENRAWEVPAFLRQNLDVEETGDGKGDVKYEPNV